MDGKSNMRERMPETARFVDAKRLEWGGPHVSECMRRAMAGEPGYFYAMERGQVFGAPFPATSSMAELQHHAVLMGSTFAAFMASPDWVSRGTH